MISPVSFSNHQEYLKAVIIERASERGSSLRAFASHLGISHSFLSRILSGERHLSVTAAVRIGRVLDLAPEEESHLLHLVALQHMKPTSRDAIASRSKVDRIVFRKSRDINNPAFKTIAEWQHFAILALSKTDGFRADPAYISKRLGIPFDVSRDSLERLVSVGLATKNGKRFVITPDVDLATKIDFPSSAVQENHRQHIIGAERALKSTPVDQREFINCTFAMNRRDMQKAKRRLRLFANRFMKDLEKDGGDELFQFNLQFYPLTKECADA
jgi:uncharacterized protein (TIGR02147 family)